MKYILALVVFSSNLFAQSVPLTLDSESVYPRRFIAAHGQRAIIEGYSAQGLEAWAYPYQLFRDYRLTLRRAGDSTAIESTLLLRRIRYTPSTVTRIYAGPDFVLRETLFVPLDRTAILIKFEIDSPAPLDIVVHLVPTMDLMWPASTGGQHAEWSPELSGFVLHENDGARALLTSPQMVAHDDQWNSTEDPFSGALGFTLRASAAEPAVLAVTADLSARAQDAPTAALATESRSLIADAASLLRTSEEHYQSLLRSSLQIETPEPEVNAAFEWATVALDQSWVCNTDLGCALTAGYGPSRRARRPQYQWFFAGDGLVGTEALLNLGEFARARQEIEFILKYQDSTSGMIWHELTQSARHLDWAGKFPYMFVHVDLSFQFLVELKRYFERTGDVDLLHQHWKQIQATYHYCESTIDRTTHLPGIPESKSGANEQDKLADELSLSTAWIDAAEAYAEIATLVNDHEASATAKNAIALAAPALISRYWDDSIGFPASAHTHDGHPAPGRSLSASSSTLLQMLTAIQRNKVLDQLASSDFQTDWGSRSLAPGSTFAPASYGKGSVWPLASTEVAGTFWRSRRSWSAEALWRAILPGQSLDSLGHFPEVFSGSFYREQEESVPEQMWSSAAFVSVTAEGLLGLVPDAAHDTLHFSPSLPAGWTFLRVRNLIFDGSSLALDLRYLPHSLELSIENPGVPLALDFRPLLPLGANVTLVKLDGKTVPFAQNSDADARLETRPTITTTVPHGSSHLSLAYSGGVAMLIPRSTIEIGETSHLYKLRSAEFSAHRITFRLDVPTDHPSVLLLRSDAQLLHPTGARLEPGPEPSTWKLIIDPAPDEHHKYTRAEASVELSTK